MAITNQQGKLILTNQADSRVEFTVTGNVLSTTGTTLDIPQIYTTGLLDYWGLEEGTTGAGDIKDTAFTAYGVGNNPGNDGTRFGTAPYTTAGIYQNGASFSNDDYISVTNNANMYNTTTMSVEFWVYVTAFAATYRVMRFGNGASNGFEFPINSGTGEMTFSLPGFAGVQTVGAIPTNAWTQIVGTFNTAGDVKIYVNGAFDNSVTCTGFSAPTGDLIIGAANTGLNSALVGSLDEIKFYSVELTAGQVLSNYNAY